MENRIEDLFNQAHAHDKKMKFEEALKCYQEVLKINPRHFVSLLNYGAINSRIKDHKKAIEAFKKCLEIKHDFRAYFNLGLEYYKIKDYPSAIENFNKCLSIKPGFLQAYLLCGYSYVEDCKTTEAITILNKGLQTFGIKESLLIGLAIAYYTSDNYEKCSKILEKIFKLNPENLIGLKINALISLKQPLRKESIEIFRKLIQNDPDLAELDSFMNEPKNEPTFKKIIQRKSLILEKKIKSSEDYLNLSLVSFLTGNGNAAMNYLLYAMKEK